jgi:O-acetyl-ADP-ribose deacetylase (regulator of RNase III)
MNIQKGDLLSVTNGIIVHGCNCQGVMGSGVAKAIRDKWPDVYDSYVTYHKSSGNLFLGDVVTVSPYSLEDLDKHVNYYTGDLPENTIVVNAMTQYNYGRDPNVIYVDYDAVEACFARVRLLARDSNLPVHFPMIGAGLGNGDWNEIVSRIKKGLGDEHFEKATLWVLP